MLVGLLRCAVDCWLLGCCGCVLLGLPCNIPIALSGQISRCGCADSTTGGAAILFTELPVNDWCDAATVRHSGSLDSEFADLQSLPG